MDWDGGLMRMVAWPLRMISSADTTTAGRAPYEAAGRSGRTQLTRRGVLPGLDVSRAGSAGQGASDSEPASRPARSHTILWRVGLALLLADVGVACLSYYRHDDPVVLGSFVPRYWHLAVILTVAGLAALAASSYRRLVNEVEGRSRPRGLLRRVGVVLTTLTVLLVAAAALVPLSLGAAITTYHVLSPRGPDGCRIVVAEDTFLLLGSGRVFVLPAGAHQARQVAQFTTDDGYRPVSLGTYRLTWTGSEADLALWGDAGAPVFWEPVPLGCNG